MLKALCLLSRNLTLLASCRSFPPKPFHAFLQPSVQSTATQRSSFSATPRQALMSGFVSTQKASSPSSLSPAGAVTAAPEGVIPQQASDTQSPPAGQVARRSGVATPSRSRLPPPPLHSLLQTQYTFRMLYMDMCCLSLLKCLRNSLAPVLLRT